MTKPSLFIYLLLTLCSQPLASRAALAIKVAEPKTYGQTTILKMDVQNTFTNSVESVRAAVFLMDASGKMVGQETRWIVGGTKDRPPLKPDDKTSFHFVVQTKKPFTKSKVTITRIVLEGGKHADNTKDVQLEFAANAN